MGEFRDASGVGRTSGGPFGHACAVELVQGLFGPVAIGVICGLLFVEEMGVPLPMFPASGLLLVAGVMIAAGDIAWYLFLPTAYVAAVGGATVGYTWARALGQRRLERLADRLRVRRHMDRVRARLHSAGSIGIGIGRIVPGSRVYTSLIAGVTAVPVPTFLRGLVVADLVWTVVLVGLGVVVGIPAAAYLHVAVGFFMQGVVVVAALLLTGAFLRLARPPAPQPATRGEGRSPATRLVTALTADVVVVGVAATAASLLFVYLGVVTEWVAILIAVSVTLFAYVAVTRLPFRSTVGESLGGVSYRRYLPDLM